MNRFAFPLVGAILLWLTLNKTRIPPDTHQGAGRCFILGDVLFLVIPIMRRG